MSANPLGPEHLDQLREGLRSAESAISIAEKAKQAGLPVDAALDKAVKTRDQLLRIKNTFFPGQ